MEELGQKTIIENRPLIFDLEIKENHFAFTSNIETALSAAGEELHEIEEQVSENQETLENLTPDCDKIDYSLAAASGVLCGIIDIFLVGKPGESPIGNVTDKWFENRIKDFAKIYKWNNSDGSLDSALRHLEKVFKIPYDQTGAGGIGSWIFDLNPSNHHFKSLGHNPTLLGLFFSILDQFLNTSHFVSGGELIALERADDHFELHGNNVPSKLFCGFANWFGHLISDVSGSSRSKGRGMGIPSPFMCWSNDIIVIKRKLNIEPSDFDKSFNETALQIYKKGYDVRFQTAQLIPVFVNELLVRLIYSVRRLIKYYKNTPTDERSFHQLWKACEPFSNATVKRMLTVAHGTFCLLDVGEAVIQGFIKGGGYFNVAEFVMRLNLPGLGRFAISMYGEVERKVQRAHTEEEIYYWRRQKIIIEDYINGLSCLAEIYDDKLLLTFIDDLKSSDLYVQAFEKTIQLAEKRNVLNDNILKDKSEIDAYFIGGKK